MRSYLIFLAFCLTASACTMGDNSTVPADPDGGAPDAAVAADAIAPADGPAPTDCYQRNKRYDVQMTLVSNSCGSAGTVGEAQFVIDADGVFTQDPAPPTLGNRVMIPAVVPADGTCSIMFLDSFIADDGSGPKAYVNEDRWGANVRDVDDYVFAGSTPTSCSEHFSFVATVYPYP